MRDLHGVILAAGMLAALAGCAEPPPLEHRAVADPPASDKPRPLPAYGLRLRSEHAETTAVYVFLRERGTEREVLVARCRDAAVETASPEGLLLPVMCDGRRLVLHREDGRLVMRNGRRTRDIGALPESSTVPGAASS